MFQNHTIFYIPTKTLQIQLQLNEKFHKIKMKIFKKNISANFHQIPKKALNALLAIKLSQYSNPMF